MYKKLRTTSPDVHTSSSLPSTLPENAIRRSASDIFPRSTNTSFNINALFSPISHPRATRTTSDQNLTRREQDSTAHFTTKDWDAGSAGTSSEEEYPLTHASKEQSGPDSELPAPQPTHDPMRDTHLDKRVDSDISIGLDAFFATESPPSSPHTVSTPPLHPSPFLHQSTLGSAVALTTYTALNAATMASITNPSTSIGLLASLTLNVPRILGEMLHQASINQAHQMDRTMYIRIVGAAITGALTTLADNHPNVLGMDTDKQANYIIGALGWTAFSSVIVDAIANALLRAMNNKTLIYRNPAPTAADLADPVQRLCSVDYLTSQANNLIKKMLGSLHIPSTQNARNALHTPQTSPEESENSRFLCKESYTWLASTIAYGTMNSLLAYFNRNNLPSLMGILSNITGYMPVLIGDIMHKIATNKPFQLDKTMAIKIISAGAIGAMMSAANHEPKTMGLSDDKKIAYAVSMMGWSAFTSFMVELATNFIHRHAAGTQLIYREHSPSLAMQADSSRYVFSGDFIISRAKALLERCWSHTTPSLESA